MIEEFVSDLSQVASKAREDGALKDKSSEL